MQLDAIFHDATNGFFYLQMPFYSRGTLMDYCAEEKLAARSLILMLQSISQALAHLHAHG